MHGLLLLANGFEDTEALTTRDVLLRAGIGITTSSINENRQVETSFGLTLLADKPITILKNFSDYDFLVLPGGGRGTVNLSESEEVKRIIGHFVKNNKLVCAICAAPSVIGNLGYLKDVKYTCYAGFNEGIDGIFTGNEVEVDGNFITARSMKYTIPFALAIVEKLIGTEAKEEVLIGLSGLREK